MRGETMKKQIRAMAAALSFGVLVSAIPDVEALAAALSEKKEKGRDRKSVV